MQQLPAMRVVIVTCFLFAQVSRAMHNGGQYTDLMWYNVDRGLFNNISDQILDLYTPVSLAVQNQRCRNHSQWYKQAIKDGKQWALRMLDAGSKVPAGLLRGNVIQLGNYDECLEVQNIAAVSGHFSGQHCMVSMAYDFESMPEMANVTNNTSDTFGQLVSLLGLKWSVCIPSSCGPQDLESHLHNILQDVLGDVTLTVGQNACRTRGQKPELTAGDWIAIVLLAIFAVIVVVSTAYDLIHINSASRSELLASFSLYTNGRKLLATSSNRDSLQAVYGIRTLAILWVVQGHTYDRMVYDSPAINSEENQHHTIIMQYRLSVDTFLVLSGLFISYVFLKTMDSGKSFNVPLYYLHRYVRLTPAYAIMILLTATIFGHIDEGPLWEETAAKEQQNCQDNWWAGILYLNNYINGLNTCMTQSWYLSVDMQLYWLSPLILYTFWKRPKFAKALLGALVFAGVIIVFIVDIVNDFPLENDAEKINLLEYLPTHTRFTPWVIGIGLGYLLHSTKDTTLKLSYHLVTVGWLLSAALIVYPIVIGNQEHFFENAEDYNKWFESFNAAVTKPAWALGIAWIIFACAKGYGGFINTFLSWNVFLVLSRLTYCVYLVHYAVILWLEGSLRTPLYLNERTMMMQFVSVVSVSFVAALLLSLIFEAPALVIEKALLGRVGTRNRTVSRNGTKVVDGDSPRAGMLIEIDSCNPVVVAATDEKREEEGFLNKSN